MPAGAPQGGMPVRKFNSQDKAGKKMVKTNSQDMVFDETKKIEKQKGQSGKKKKEAKEEKKGGGCTIL